MFSRSCSELRSCSFRQLSFSRCEQAETASVVLIVDRVVELGVDDDLTVLDIPHHAPTFLDVRSKLDTFKHVLSCLMGIRDCMWGVGTPERRCDGQWDLV